MKWSEIQVIITDRLGWPSWAVDLIASLSVLVVLAMIIQQYLATRELKRVSKSNHEDNASAKVSFSFRIFQIKYLSVYLITMLADWLQGTNMYTLYTSYGVNVGTLFLTGFLTSAIFGTFLGMYIDRWGRKLGCIIFCLLEIIINLIEHIPSMPALLLGRVLGGLSTSLLFTAFESWMVSEHRRQGFEEHLMAGTFSIASAGNGIMAILAGLFAQRATDVSGEIGPFQFAILLTIVALVLILPWNENYGHEDPEEKKQTDKTTSESQQQSSFWHSMMYTLQLIRQYPDILLLGLSQAFFEGAVYTFVFMWVPSLMIANNGSIPTGLVFSVFMLSMTFGGMLFSILLSLFPGQAEGLCIILYLCSAGAMAVPLLISFDFWTILYAFLVLEAMVGMFNSCGGTLRSQYYPEGVHSSIMSVFRLPLNLLVVLGTKLADSANDVTSLKFAFGVIVVMHLIAAVLQGLLTVRNSLSSSSKVKLE